jgi:hypothetical protein
MHNRVSRALPEARGGARDDGARRRAGLDSSGTADSTTTDVSPTLNDLVRG